MGGLVHLTRDVIEIHIKCVIMKIMIKRKQMLSISAFTYHALPILCSDKSSLPIHSLVVDSANKADGLSVRFHPHKHPNRKTTIPILVNLRIIKIFCLVLISGRMVMIIKKDEG